MSCYSRVARWRGLWGDFAMHQVTPLYLILYPEVPWLYPAPSRSIVPPELPAGVSHLPPWIPVPCHRSLPPTPHPHLGKGWTWHSHTAPWAHWGVEEPPIWPQWGLQHSATAVHNAHSHPSLPPACAAPGTCPRGRLRCSGAQTPWSWGSAAPMSHWLPWGIPCALQGTQPLLGATSSQQTTARHPCSQPTEPVWAQAGADLLLHVPAGGFCIGHMQRPAKPHLHSP